MLAGFCYLVDMDEPTGQKRMGYTLHKFVHGEFEWKCVQYLYPLPY